MIPDYKHKCHAQKQCVPITIQPAKPNQSLPQRSDPGLKNLNNSVYGGKTKHVTTIALAMPAISFRI